MPRPSFNNVGLRRDLNLSDLPNPDAALDNLLNDLVTTQDGSTFDGQDLKIAVEGISNTNVSNASISKLRGVAVQNTILENGVLVDRLATPLITMKNQVDTILATTNDPPFFNGGDGLFANFYEPDQITPQGQMGILTDGDSVVTGAPVVRKKFWSNGLFEFSNKLDDTLGGANGMIQWEGFYIPDASGPTTFSFSTTGLFIFEFENDDGDLEIKRNVYDIERSVFAEADTLGDTFTTTAQQARTLAIGDELTTIIIPGQPNVEFNPGEGPVVTSVGINSGNVTVNADITVFDGYELVFSCENNLGTNEFRITHVEPELVKYVPYRLRITYWYPGEDVEFFNKVLDANITTALKSDGDWPYWYLYTEVGDQEVDEGFKGFYDKRLLLGGGTIGPEDVIVPTQYNKFQSIKPLVLKYDPPLTYSDAVRAEYTYEVTQFSNVIGTTVTSPYTDNIEIGTKIIADEIPLGSQVTDISSNNIVIFDDAAIATGSIPIIFMDHRGYLTTLDATSNGTSVTVNNTAGIKEGTVIVANGMPETGTYVRVVSVDTNRIFSTNRPLQLAGTQKIHLYSDRGLNNNAYDKFCQGVLGKEIAVSANPGDTTVTLNNVDDIIVGMVFMSSPYLPTLDENNLLNTRTQVTSINAGTNTVTIDRPLLGNFIIPSTPVDVIAGQTITVSSGQGSGTVALTQTNSQKIFLENVTGTFEFDIGSSIIINGSTQTETISEYSTVGQAVVGTTVVLAAYNTTQDKEPCVVPLNTAPPFVGTLEGLRTTDGNTTNGILDAYKGLKMTNTNGTLKVTNLVVSDISDVSPTGVETYTIIPGTNNAPFDRRISIECDGVNFDILATTDNVTNIQP